VAGQFQLFASNGDKWQAVKGFKNSENLALAQSEADQLVESGQFRNIMIVEKTAGDPKAKFKPVYRKSLNSKKAQKTERLELVVKKGLTGEWIVIPEKYAKRYKYYGVYGFLCWIYFVLITGPIFEVIASLGGYGETLPLDSIPVLSTFAVYIAMSWGVAWALWTIKRRAVTIAITYFSVIGVLVLLGGGVIPFGKCIFAITYLLLSRRVNATYRHRIKRRDLEYTIPLKKLENAKFVSAKSARKKKHR